MYCAHLPQTPETLGEPFVKINIPCAIVIDVTKEQDGFIMLLQRWLTDSSGYLQTPPLRIGWLETAKWLGLVDVRETIRLPIREEVK